MVKAELEVFGKVYEVSFADFLSASAKADVLSAFTSSSSPAPASSGGLNFDWLDDVAYLLAFPLDPLGDANRVLKTHATIAHNPWVAVIAKFAFGWSNEELLREAVKRKHLLLELWRELDGYGDEMSNEVSEQQVLSWSVFQPDATKPPPQTFKPSPVWASPSSPRTSRAPDAFPCD